MPEAAHRGRLARQSGGWTWRLTGWFHRNRPKFAVLAAFAVACAMGMAAASIGMQGLGPVWAAKPAAP